MNSDTEHRGRRFGPYTCIRRLGAGGMGEAFLAVKRGEHAFEQRVCIKTTHPAYREIPDFMRLFFQEATIAASLRHSNIVGVIDASHEDGYIVLELVDGADLRTVLKEQPSRKLPPRLVMWVMLELCRALEHAHNRTHRGKPAGIVHRDVSPSNVIISYAGEVKLTDFGIAKAMNVSGGEASTLKGKVVYMAPEQVTGQAVDGRTDLFSVGVTAYELLTGRRPFDADNDAATLKRITTGEYVPLAELDPDLPAGLTGIVDRLLSVDPADRFQSAADVIDAIARLSPTPTAYRELGKLAEKARPHVTLFAEDDTQLEERLSPSQPVARTTRTNENEGVPGTAPQAQAAQAEPPRAEAPAERESGGVIQTEKLPEEPLPETRTALPAETGDNEPRRFPLGRRAALALGAAAAVVLAVVAALLAGESDEQAATDVAEESAAATSTAAPPAVASASVGEPTEKPASPEVTPAEPTEPAPSEPESRPEPESEAPALAQAPKPAAPTPPKTKPRPAPVRRGKLQVGVFPTGKVWVDGRLRGRAPITLSLPAGAHTVAAGRDQPAKSRQVTISAGQTEEVVFNIRGAGSGAGR